MIPIFDNGHGGVINGVYQTAGKRSPNWDKGVLYEGEFNRWIVDGVTKRLTELNKEWYNVCAEPQDISLSDRVKRANSIHKKRKNTYLFSVHANAGGGTGWEIFTSPGQTKSDEIAEKYAQDFKKNFPDHRARVDMSDGDMDKEENFYILKNTIGPAVLFEVAFMDNKDDYAKLWDPNFRKRVIDSLVETTLKLY